MSKNSTYLRVAKRNKKSNDRAKLQIKSEKPLLLEDFFSGRGANPLTLTLTVQNSATLLLREKRVKEKVYIYIYINIKLYY